MKLRLLVTKKCHRDCEGCCNKEWDLDALPICTDFRGYESIMLTGGEPLLNLRRVQVAIREIRAQNKQAKIYIYTALLTNRSTAMIAALLADGMTITLHDQRDVEPLQHFIPLFYKVTKPMSSPIRSMRLNVFKGIDISFVKNIPRNWKVKTEMEWIPNCPLPEGEIFMRYV